MVVLRYIGRFSFIFYPPFSSLNLKKPFKDFGWNAKIKNNTYLCEVVYTEFANEYHNKRIFFLLPPPSTKD